jgi:hypothetical protein
LLGAMKAMTNFGSISDNFGMKSPLDMTNTLFPCIQDAIHTANKMKTRLLNDSNQLFVGQTMASIQHLRELVNDPKLTKMNHGLTQTDVNSSDSTKDKMSFSSTLRMCDDRVLELLKSRNIGTYYYLKVMNSFIRAFIVEKEKVTDRLLNSTYVVMFLRLWKKHLETNGLTLDNFISKNAWESIELNHAFLIRLMNLGKAHLITLCCSQSCEKFFRNLRSLTSSGLTEINFNLQECLMKINKIQALELLHSQLRDLGYVMKSKYNLETISSEMAHEQEEGGSLFVENEFISRIEISQMVLAATTLAKMDAQACGMKIQPLNLESNFHYPDLSLSMINETRDFFKKYHQTYEIEYEEIPIENGMIDGTFVVFKNLKLLNIPLGI